MCCCSEAVEIYPAGFITDIKADTIEINGVNGSIAQWRHVLLPLLGLQQAPSVSDIAKEGFKFHWESVV